MFKRFPQRKANRIRAPVSLKKDGEGQSSSDPVKKSKKEIKRQEPRTRRPHFLKNVAGLRPLSGRRVVTPPVPEMGSNTSQAGAKEVAISPKNVNLLRKSNVVKPAARATFFRGELSRRMSLRSGSRMISALKLGFKQTKRNKQKRTAQSLASSSSNIKEKANANDLRRKESERKKKTFIQLVSASAKTPMEIESRQRKTGDEKDLTSTHFGNQDRNRLSKIHYSMGRHYVPLLRNKQVDLSGKNLSDKVASEVLKSLASSPAEEVFLHCNRISMRGSKSLCYSLERTSFLRVLILSHNQIDDEGTKWLGRGLRGNRTLQSLSLDFNKIGDIGVKCLASSLGKNENLEVLDLENNLIGDEGAGHLAKAIDGNSYLTELDIAGNKIEESGLQILLKAVKKNPMIVRMTLMENPGHTQGIKDTLKEVLKNNKKSRKSRKKVVRSLSSSEKKA